MDALNLLPVLQPPRPLALFLVAIVAGAASALVGHLRDVWLSRPTRFRP